MWQPLWHLLKLIAYVLPFIHEVTDEQSIKDEKDATVLKHLKRLVTSIIAKLLYFCVFCIIVFYFALPLYSEKRILERDLEKRIEVIVMLNHRIEKFSDLLNAAQQNTRQCEVKLTAKDEDIRRLTNTIAEFRRNEAIKNTTPTQPVEKAVINKPNTTTIKEQPQKSQSKPAPTKSKPTVSSSVEKRLKQIE